MAETESQADLALHLPPFNTDADKPEDVYPFDDRILHSICVCFPVRECKNWNCRLDYIGYTLLIHKWETAVVTTCQHMTEEK